MFLVSGTLILEVGGRFLEEGSTWREHHEEGSGIISQISPTRGADTTLH